MGSGGVRVGTGALVLMVIGVQVGVGQGVSGTVAGLRGEQAVMRRVVTRRIILVFILPVYHLGGAAGFYALLGCFPGSGICASLRGAWDSCEAVEGKSFFPVKVLRL